MITAYGYFSHLDPSVPTAIGCGVVLSGGNVALDRLGELLADAAPIPRL